MGDEPVLLVETAERVRTITFNRADAGNAFNLALWHAAADALTAANDDPGVACVVLTGAGDAYCTGQDLRELMDPAATETIVARANHFVHVLERFDKPLLAAVNGTAIGVGMTMLAFCDIVVVASNARLRAPFVSLGLTTEAASSLTFVERMGWQQAAHVLFAAPWVDAEQAVEIGLAWKVVPGDELRGAVAGLARSIAAMPISSLRTTKQLMKADLAPRIRAAAQREADAFDRLLRSPAHAEALAAFAERRAPVFEGIDT